MEPITLTILTSLGASYLANFTTPTIQKFFAKAFALDPTLESKLQNAKTSQDFESVFSEAVGVIDARAADAEIEVDGGLLEALRGIRFDHENGTVSISGSTISAPILETGGTGTGTTHITDSELKSRGTGIKVGKGASIKITGNAGIRQS